MKLSLAQNRIFLLALVALIAFPALADEPSGKTQGPDMAAAMAAMQKAAAPGDNHRFLASMEGDWTFPSTVWMEPGAPPMTSPGVSKKTMILDGRYLQDNTEGNMMGKTFHGHGITAYDNTAGEFINTWIDSMSTGLAVARGSRDGNTLELSGDYVDPMSKQKMKVRYATRVVDQDHHVFEYYMTVPGMPEFKSMMIEYTRKTSE